MKTPPLAWSIDVHSIHKPLSLDYEAGKDERLALAGYCDIEEVKSFTSHLKVSPLSAGRFKLSGTLRADVIQASVVNLEPVSAVIDESFSVEFWPAEMIAERGADASSFEKDAPEAIRGDRIPAGEFLSELLSVSLDPYPRNEGEEFAWADGGEAKVTPFAELAKLRDKKSGGD